MKERKLSTSSMLLAAGAWPVTSNSKHQMVSLCFYHDELPDRQEVIARLSAVLPKFYRFTSKAVKRNGVYTWVEIDMDWNEYVRVVNVENNEEMRMYTSELLNRPYKSEGARWNCTILRNRRAQTEQKDESREGGQGGASECWNYDNECHASVFRFDHSLGDGISMVEVFCQILTDVDGRPFPIDQVHGLTRDGTKPQSSDESKCRRDKSLSSILLRGIRTISKNIKIAGQVAYGCLWGIARLLESTLGPHDTQTNLKSNISALKREGVKAADSYQMFRARPINFEYIRQLRLAAGCTVNDVVLAAFAGAVRDYIDLETGSAASVNKAGVGVRVHALLPYAFPRDVSSYSDPETALKNNFAVVPVRLALEGATVEARVAATIKKVKKLKRSGLPYIFSFVQRFIGAVCPIKMSQNAAGDLFQRASIVFANVPGPKASCKFAGKLITECQIGFCSVLPQVEALSYGGRLFFNIVGDAEMKPSLSYIPIFFEKQLQLIGETYQLSTSTPLFADRIRQ